MSVRPILLPLTLVIAFAVSASQPRLVDDIVTKTVKPRSSKPVLLLTVGNTTYFLATHPLTGTELWKSDGTTAGTTLVRDIRVGESSAFNGITGAVAGNRFVFTADDGQHGIECWTTDGTYDGTQLLADINPGAASANIRLGAIAGTIVYFTAYTAETGVELWRTDGTAAGTRMVTDLNPGPQAALPIVLGVTDSRVIFRATDGTRTGIFASDGTPDGTRYVAPYNGVKGASLESSVLFMSEDSTTHRMTLVRTDGTTSGTMPVRDGFAADAGAALLAFGDTAYIVAGPAMNELWRSNGTSAGTSLIRSTPAGSSFTGLWPFGSRLLLMMNYARGQLWIMDTTGSGATLLKEIPNAITGAVWDGHFYFGWDDHIHGGELWRTDGTPQGTQLFADIVPGAVTGMDSSCDVIARPGGVLFSAAREGEGIEPWFSDGTIAGTRLIKNIAEDEELGSGPGSLAAVGDKLFFLAWSDEMLIGWTDAVASHVTRIPAAAGAENGVGSGNLYFFIANEKRELWRSDGTPEGTFRLFTMPDGRQLSNLLPFHGGVYFAGVDVEHGVEPWFSDGSVAGTRMLADIKPGAEGSLAYSKPAVAGDWIYFSATPPAGEETWRTDGTAAGTTGLGFRGALFTRVKHAVYFFTTESGSLRLWRQNDDSAAHVLVHEFAYNELPRRIVADDDTLFFFQRGSVWRSDGTAAGTYSVANVAQPQCSNFGDTGVAVGDGVLYWYATRRLQPTDLFYVDELWRSDGTAAGTFALAEHAAPSNCLADDLHYVNGHLYFAANDHDHGVEPWVTDGTTGTFMLYDVNPGKVSSNPRTFFSVGPNLFFAATHFATGSELWTMCIADCGTKRRAVRP